MCILGDLIFLYVHLEWFLPDRQGAEKFVQRASAGARLTFKTKMDLCAKQPELTHRTQVQSVVRGVTFTQYQSEHVGAIALAFSLHAQSVLSWLSIPG